MSDYGADPIGPSHNQATRCSMSCWDCSDFCTCSCHKPVSAVTKNHAIHGAVMSQYDKIFDRMFRKQRIPVSELQELYLHDSSLLLFYDFIRNRGYFRVGDVFIHETDYEPGIWK